MPMNPTEQFIFNLFGNTAGNIIDIQTLVRQMSFGLIQLEAPPGQPSLLSQATFILQAIQAEHNDLIAYANQIVHQNNQIISMLQNQTPSNLPVVLPSTPPAGYGANNSAIALEVWTYGLPSGANTGDALNDVYASTQALGGNTFVTIPGYPWMVAQTLDNWQNLADQALGPPVVLDERTILPTDASILAWANRAHPGPAGWTSSPLFGHNTPRQIDANTANVRWWITMTPAEFASFQATPAQIGLPPVWPGVANVTLSTPVALALGVTITEPMDGVIISITGAPTKQGFFTFDDLISWRNVGSLVFLDDNGEAEGYQQLNFTSQVYCPKSMKQAAAVKLRASADITGTITPWTIT